MANKWKPTHIITHDGQTIEVMLDEGRGYTKEEWDEELHADYSLFHGVWFFMGQPFSGRVRDADNGPE